MASASPLKRLNYRVWMRSAAAIGSELAANGGSAHRGTRLRYALGYPFLYRALRDRMGLRQCRWRSPAPRRSRPRCSSGSSGIGVAIHEIYGMTENSAVATMNRPGRLKLGTVGEPQPGIELRIDEQTSEVLTRHPAVFTGYWNNPSRRRRRWTRTAGCTPATWASGWRARHVRIVDRLKDIIITAGGKNISPSEIENSLKFSPYVKEAVVVGDRRPYLTALMGIELDTVSDWAQRQRIPYTTYRDLSEKPEVLELVHGVVRETNERFARPERIKKFRMIVKELDHEDGELTATQKVKRAAIAECSPADRGHVRGQAGAHGERRLGMEELLSSTVRGLGQGSLYALLGLGFVIVYKSTRVINFAQPVLMILGAYFTSAFAVDQGLPFALAVALAVLVDSGDRRAGRANRDAADGGRAGVLRGNGHRGIFFVLQVIAADLIGSGQRGVGDPWGLDRFEVRGVTVFEATRADSDRRARGGGLGGVLQVLALGPGHARHILQPGDGAGAGRACGRMFSLAWMLAGALGALAGMLVGTGGADFDQTTTLVALKALPAIILGGLDSIRGAIVGGLAIGLAEAYTKTYQADHFAWLGSNFDQVVPYIVMLIVLLVRPYGLFGTPEVQRV